MRGVDNSADAPEFFFGNPRHGQCQWVSVVGTDENLILTPRIKHTLEQALEFIEDDELVEVTPESVRTRKKLLTENARKRAPRLFSRT